MIIQCENCNKRFEIQDNLIPDEGRLLECGSCAHQWQYTPITKLELTDDVQIKDKPTKQLIAKKKTKKISKIKKKVYKNSADGKIYQTNENGTKKEKNISFINFILVGIISFVAIVILVDTFKNQIAYVVPNINLYISGLHEILRDIFLFIADLSK